MNCKDEMVVGFATNYVVLHVVDWFEITVKQQ